MTAAIDIISDPAQAASMLSPLRLRILESLRTPGSSTTVAEELGIPRQKANYHVRTLEKHGLVEHVEDRRKGNCTERVVRATARHYLIASSLLGSLEARPDETRDRRSSAHLAAISARTVSEVAELRERAKAAGKKLATFSLETAVRFENASDHAEFMEKLANAVAGLVSEYHTESAPGGRWFRLALGAHPALPAANATTHESQPAHD